MSKHAHEIEIVPVDGGTHEIVRCKTCGIEKRRRVEPPIPGPEGAS